jgi:hypothetical protein
MQAPITLADVAEAPTWYNARIRHPDHRRLNLSLPYDLVPHTHVGEEFLIARLCPPVNQQRGTAAQS